MIFLQSDSIASASVLLKIRLMRGSLWGVMLRIEPSPRRKLFIFESFQDLHEEFALDSVFSHFLDAGFSVFWFRFFEDFDEHCLVFVVVGESFSVVF